MHLSLPKDIPSEKVENGSFQNTGKYSYCGPFTKLDKRLKQGYKGVNSLDESCKQHDIAYAKFKSTKERNLHDDILALEAAKIANDPSKPAYERKDARLVGTIMSGKSRFGMGMKVADAPLITEGAQDAKHLKLLEKIYYDPKTGFTGVQDLMNKTGLPRSTVKNWLEKQDVYTLHKPIKHKFPTRRVLVNGIDDQWQADLVDMRNYKDGGYNYILTVIDVFSKYAWAVPIKRKTGEEVSNAFKILFKQRKPRKLHTDKGLEFINKPTKQLLKENEIHWFATENETKAQVVERFNRTLKNRMWKYFTKQESTQNWVKILPDFVKNYNTTKHRSIGMKPTEASLKKNEAEVYKTLFPETDVKMQKPKFQVGDQVRITQKRGDFRKGYRPNFTKEIFIISEILDTQPITYRITAQDGEEITGSLYEQEISLVLR